MSIIATFAFILVYTYSTCIIRIIVQRKLTITVSEEVYKGLHAKIGAGRISKFLDALARPHVVDDDLERAYKAMAADRGREAEALEWSENLAPDAADETR